MTFERTPTAAAAVGTAATTPRRRRASGFARTTAFLLVATVVVLAGVIRVGECRSLQVDNYRQQRIRRVASKENNDYVADSANNDEDEDSEELNESDKSIPLPTIQTSNLVVESVEGTTVNLPCKVVNATNVDDLAVFWINGTKSIMTDGYVVTTDPRVKPNKQLETSTEFLDHTLIIEQVTRWDSGPYTCRVSSTPPVEITHTLRVTGPAKILMVGDSGSLATGGSKKVTVKQGEPVQLVCVVAGYPEPTVQWTRRAKYHQQPLQPAMPSVGQDQKIPESPTPISSTVVVSNTHEVRIESVVAYQDAGFYECIAHNGVSTGSALAPGEGPNAAAARLGLELEVEYPPDIVVPRRVVNTGEMYNAQMACSVQAYPKVKVTWEKEVVTSDGVSSTTPVVIEGPNSRYDTFRHSSVNNAFQGIGNTTAVPVAPTFVLKVKQVQGPQDFGRYRCRAENRQGVSYSEYITLTGSPAQPLSSSVLVTNKAPELSWTVDSLSPVLEYQLQYRRQQDSQNSYADVKPQPHVVESTVNSSGDERRYAVSYVFDGNSQPQKPVIGSATVPIILQYGTTYVARLRAKNVHGWSDWSAEVVFSGGMDDDQEANEITQNNGHQHNDNVSKASVGASGASGLQQYYSSALVTSIVLAVIAVASSAATTC